MSDFQFTWKSPPSVVAGTIRRRAAQIVPALADYAGSEAERYASSAKQNRSWSDRTNAARAGLFGAVEANGSRIDIYLSHTVEYGIFLELGTSHAAPYPIIEPTIRQQAPKTVQGAAELVRRIMAGG